MKNIALIFLTLMVFCEVQAQDNSIENAPYITPTSKPFPTGKNVYGIFEGRCACQELAQVLKKTVSADCFKTKWKLELYQNPDTYVPTNYALEGSFYRQTVRKGIWCISRGTKTDADAIIFELHADKQETIFLLKGDNNVLFFLDPNRNILTGNEHFNYTLNRVEKKLAE